MESIFHRALVPFTYRMERERVPVGDRASGCGRVTDNAPAPIKYLMIGVSVKSNNYRTLFDISGNTH